MREKLCTQPLSDFLPQLLWHARIFREECADAAFGIGDALCFQLAVNPLYRIGIDLIRNGQLCIGGQLVARL